MREKDVEVGSGSASCRRAGLSKRICAGNVVLQFTKLCDPHEELADGSLTTESELGRGQSGPHTI